MPSSGHSGGGRAPQVVNAPGWDVHYQVEPRLGLGPAAYRRSACGCEYQGRRVSSGIITRAIGGNGTDAGLFVGAAPGRVQFAPFNSVRLIPATSFKPTPG